MPQIYKVLARKYRPQNFKELVGQTHIVRTLCNALDSQNLHHAFLFTGTRGVGKTTIARILAKSINCEKGISSTPCGKCSSCVEITEGNSVDLIELDAASRTGIDDMREILENSQYMPTKSKFKIYLIDEVHMLSKNSFNALLKTLEEPPLHVKFLFATTNQEKLPITILSRCLQFNLQKLSVLEIQNQLEYIMKIEKHSYDLKALNKIANAGNGSMRDALSLLDQAIAYGGGNVIDSEIRTMLGFISKKDVVRIAKYLFSNKVDELLELITTLAKNGENFENILKSLISLIHKLTILKISPEVKSNDTELLELNKITTPEDLQLFYQIAIDGQKDLRFAPSDQVGFEMTLLRMLTFKPNSNIIKTQNIEKANNKEINKTNNEVVKKKSLI